jgi:sugar phosphate isomerase/epimerase
LLRPDVDVSVMSPSVHPRVSVNSLSSLYQPLTDDIALWHELGVDQVGLISPKMAAVGWDEGRALVADAGVRVSNVAAEEHVVMESLALAAAMGAGCVYINSGGVGALPWDDAAAAFCTRIAPAAARAHELGVRLGVEPTNPLRADLSFVFTLRDAIDLARDAGIAVVLDLYSCWYERGLADIVRRNLELVALVQINDFALGTFDTPNRVVCGDGDIPLERILGDLLDAGYEGPFDLEVLGPRIEAEGYTSAIRRSVDCAGEILTRLGA